MEYVVAIVHRDDLTLRSIRFTATDVVRRGTLWLKMPVEICRLQPGARGSEEHCEAGYGWILPFRFRRTYFS